jgi:hypothetical protein
MFGATACQGWQQVQRPTANGTLEGNPEIVRVTKTMGCGPTPSRSCMENRGTITLHNPRVQGDSLIGYYDAAHRERVAIAVSDITDVEAKKVDKLRTTGAVLGGAVVTYAVITVAVLIALLASLD